MPFDKSEAISFLARKRYDFETAISAANVPAPRVAKWLRSGEVPLLGEANPGRGNSRSFHLWDLYSLRLFAALTDSESGLSLSLKAARAIIEGGLLIEAELPGISTGALHVMRSRLEKRLEDGVLTGADMQRSLEAPRWLVGGPVTLIEPPSTVWRGTVHEKLDDVLLPNPTGRPRALIAIELDPHLISVERFLYDRLALDVVPYWNKLHG